MLSAAACVVPADNRRVSAARAARREETMSPTAEINTVRDDAELLALAGLLAHALRFRQLEETDWLRRYQRSWFRLARRGGAIAGGLARLPMGQWFGGREVAMVGIHAVGVAPEHRGAGVATALMRHTVAELAAERVPLSVLVPATQPLYRRVGYEQAGLLTRYAVPIALAGAPDRQLAIERVDTSDVRRAAAVLAPVYRAWARSGAGLLERSEWLWWRAFIPELASARTFAVREHGRITGYATYAPRAGSDPDHHDLGFSDFVALTQAASRRLWTLVADHHSLSERAIVPGSAAAPGLLPLVEQTFTVARQRRWMARITSVAAALAARGYPTGLAARIELDIDDPLVAENRGRFALAIEGGRGTVTAGAGSGALKIDIRGLAPLYTGLMTAEALAGAGLAAGPDAALAAATAAFAGPLPWMVEFF